MTERTSQTTPRLPQLRQSLASRAGLGARYTGDATAGYSLALGEEGQIKKIETTR
jgi:hypothetical protein